MRASTPTRSAEEEREHKLRAYANGSLFAPVPAAMINSRKELINNFVQASLNPAQTTQGETHDVISEFYGSMFAPVTNAPLAEIIEEQRAENTDNASLDQTRTQP